MRPGRTSARCWPIIGARVVHVEAKDRPDGFRLQYPPFAGNRHGVNRGGCFSYFNDSKYGVTIDLKKPAGVELARRLCRWCDIVIENMRPGVMDRLGLGFETLSKINPRLVMLSTCNMGQTGPRADQPGFGSQLSALGGFCGMTGFPDGPPMLLYGPYIDFIASSLGTAAVLAGVIRARRSGKGAFLDVSQYECGVLFMAERQCRITFQPAILPRVAAMTIATLRRMARFHAATANGWPCRAGPTHEFAVLARMLRHPELADDERFATLAARKANAKALGEVISAWSLERRAAQTADILQAVGIAAYPVVEVAGLFSDPQLVARRQWRVRRHPEIGDQTYCFPGFDLEQAPGDIVSAAPCLGADNNFVFRELVGVTEAEMQGYATMGVFG